MNYRFLLILNSIVLLNFGNVNACDIIKQRQQRRQLNNELLKKLITKNDNKKLKYLLLNDEDKFSITNFNIPLSNALLLTTSETIMFIYPREMGYEKDFFQIVFKLKNNTKLKQFRIEDAIFDNRTWCIYFLITNLNGGSQLIKLRRVFTIDSTTTSSSQNDETINFEYQIAETWLIAVLLTDTNAKMLSLDINIKMRRLYWLEFNNLNKTWSIVCIKIHRFDYRQKFNYKIKYFSLNSHKSGEDANSTDKSDFLKFSTDGYIYIAVVAHKRPLSNNNIITFISNNETLYICYLNNITCHNYFESSASIKPSTSNNKNSLISSNDSNQMSSFNDPKTQQDELNLNYEEEDEDNYWNHLDDYDDTESSLG
jgi:hypothetical protein